MRTESARMSTAIETLRRRDQVAAVALVNRAILFMSRVAMSNAATVVYVLSRV